MSKLATKLSSGALDLAQASWAGRGAASKPARELLVGVGRLPARQRIGRNRPAVARSAARLWHSLASDEPGDFQTLEMNTHPTRVKRKLCG